MHLLCPTDFSETAMLAADVAAALAAKMRIPLKLQHSATDAVVSVEMPVISQIEERAKAALEMEAARLRARGIEVDTGLHYGRPAEDILHGAQPHSTRMIVMGSVGRGMAGRWLIGSVAERVAEHAPVPTLVVRQAEPLLSWLEGGADLQVLCGVDFSVSSEAALLAVKSLGKLAPCHVHAAYVEWPHDWPWPTPEGYVDLGGAAWEMTSATHQRDLEARVNGFLEGLPTTVHIRGTGGRLDYEFVRLADELHSGLLVVGTHQRHGLQRLKGPSFSRGTLAHASGNVLCVPLASYSEDLQAPVIRKVLVATDFSAGGNGALRYAYSMVGQGGVVHLLHVQPPVSETGLKPGSDPDGKMSGQRAIQDRLRVLVPEGQAARTGPSELHVVVQKNVASAICETACRVGADLICVGSRGNSRAGGAELGSVVQAVIAQSKVPVLTVPVREG